MRSRWAALTAWMRGQPGDCSPPWRIFWVALVVRLLYITLAHTYRMRVAWDHFEYGWEMGRIARALTTGYGYADPFNGHSGPTAWAPPLFPLLLAGVFKLFGVYTLTSAWIILAIDSVFSAATALAIYEIAWRCFGRSGEGLAIALWSGWLWALYPAAMQYAVRWIWDMSLTACLFAWVLVLALRIRSIGEPVSQPTTDTRQPTTSWLLFGLLWGLIALSNSSLLAFLPACGLWMVWPALRRPGLLAGTLRNATLAAVCCVAVVSPWVARNWYAFHAFVPMRANFGAELYKSVEPGNNGFPWGTTLPLVTADPEFQTYRRMGEIAYSRRQAERARLILRANPRTFVRYFVQRIYFFWIGVPHPNEQAPAIEVFRTINFAFLSLSGLLGLALALSRKIPGAWLFLWAFAVIPLLYYAITVQARFRHPLEPLICILAVYLFRSADRTRLWSNSIPEGAAI